jgi:hypothetical protein
MQTIADANPITTIVDALRSLWSTRRPATTCSSPSWVRRDHAVFSVWPRRVTAARCAAVTAGTSSVAART